MTRPLDFFTPRISEQVVSVSPVGSVALSELHLCNDDFLVARNKIAVAAWVLRHRRVDVEAVDRPTGVRCERFVRHMAIRRDDRGRLVHRARVGAARPPRLSTKRQRASRLLKHQDRKSVV